MAPQIQRRRPRPLPHLPNEIWTAILAHLKLPIPPPLSDPDPSTLQNPSLCAAARVCKAWNFICEKLLYAEITTCHLPLLLTDILTPSKQRLLSHTRSLHIEYSLSWGDVSYITIFLGATDHPHEAPRRASREIRQHEAFDTEQMWRQVGVLWEDLPDEWWWRCEREVKELLRCLKALKGHGLSQILPNLESVAIGTTYGRQKPLREWTHCVYGEGSSSFDDADLTETCLDLLMDVVDGMGEQWAIGTDSASSTVCEYYEGIHYVSTGLQAPARGTHPPSSYTHLFFAPTPPTSRPSTSTRQLLYLHRPYYF